MNIRALTPNLVINRLLEMESKVKWFRSFSTGRLLLQVALFLASPANAQDAQAVLADMLRSSNALSSNLSVERRIEVFENIQKGAQKILDEYPSSNEAILILSGQKIGNFDLTDLQRQYIEELGQFYSSTCIFEPSNQCLAYVALKIGVESCESAKSFSDISLAQTKIKNAIRIFAKSSESTQIKNLSLSEFRNCVAASKLTNQKELDDYFLSQLIPIYLEIGDEDQARAVIQKIDDPYLTFISVIELTKARGEISRDFLRRMSDYVTEKRISGGERVLSGLDLSLLALELEIDPAIESFQNFAPSGQCAANSTANIILNRTVDYIERLWEFQQGAAFLNNLVKLDSAVRYLQYNCSSSALGEALAGYIYFRTASQSLAEQYLQRARASNFESKAMQEVAFNLYSENKFNDAKNRFQTLSALTGTQALRTARTLSQKFVYPFSEYTALKISMTDGNFCNSVGRLFKDYITNPSAEAEEVSGLLDFALSTNLLNSDEACGDASLELLLK